MAPKRKAAQQQTVQSTSTPQPEDFAPANDAVQEPVNKKKRKQWGQPVPDFVPVIGPRKRAKTEAEKEQRKIERIVRNRNAADKSRQRQKGRQAALEKKNALVQTEAAGLRLALEQYMSLYGPLDGVTVPERTPEKLEEEDEFIDTKGKSADKLPKIEEADTPAPSKFVSAPASDFGSEYTGTTALDSPYVHLTDPSYTFDTMNTIQAAFPFRPFGNSTSNSMFSNDMAMASSPASNQDSEYYPAAIVYDPQCPESRKVTKLEMMVSQAKKTPRLSSFLQLLHYLLISSPEVALMHWTLISTSNILAQASKESCRAFISQELEKCFLLMHTLISMPSTASQPAVFRLTLLHYFLASSPHISAMLSAVIDEALSVVSSREDFAEDEGCQWNFSSLMTIKWAIMRYDQQSRKISISGKAGVASASKSSKKCDNITTSSEVITDDILGVDCDVMEGVQQKSCQQGRVGGTTEGVEGVKLESLDLVQEKRHCTIVGGVGDEDSPLFPLLSPTQMAAELVR